MTTLDPQGSLGLDEARAHISEAVFAKRLGGPEVGRVGLEPEYLVLRLDSSSDAVARLPLEGASSVLSALEDGVSKGAPWRLTTPGPPPAYELPDGGRLTFEPGGQIEHSTAIHATAAVAMDDVDAVAGELTRALAGEGARLVSAGLDLWTDRSLVEQQLRAPRYASMDAFLHGRSEHGRVMMRHTGSFQVNLDLGERPVAEERWLLANLLSPVATASFACSPEEGYASRRARAWQGLDPSRTGFPACFLSASTACPAECYAELALDADVLLFRTAGDGATPGSPGFRFRDWIADGHPEHGRPGRDDLDYHLTTLFPEVRLRGFFEVRSNDAIPLRWRAAQVVFWAGLLYDPDARRAALERLRPWLSSLPERWAVSARDGLREAELGEAAKEIWRLALEGAGRMPADFFRARDLTTAEDFLTTFVDRGRAPADELRRLLDEDPAAAARWCGAQDGAPN